MNYTLQFKSDTRKLDRRVAKAKKSLPEVMQGQGTLAARRAAFFMHRSTLPSQGNAPWPFAKMEQRIREDVEKGYATKEDPRWENKAYTMIRDHKSKEVADRWWSEYKSQGIGSEDIEGSGVDFIVNGYEEKFDKMRFIPRKSNLSEYQKLRREKGRTSLPAGVNLLGFLSSARREAFAKKRQKTKGLAKAGWFAVARGLGSRGYRDGGNAGVRFTWPKQISNPFRLFGGLSLGSATVVGTEQGYRFSITNHVRYSGDESVLPEALKDLAFDLTRKEMKHQAALRLKHGRFMGRGRR